MSAGSPTDPEPRFERIEADLAALKTSTAYGFGQLNERLDALKELVSAVAARPAPGVPLWVVLAAVAPGTLLSAATLVLALVLLRGG